MLGVVNMAWMVCDRHLGVKLPFKRLCVRSKYYCKITNWRVLTDFDSLLVNYCKQHLLLISNKVIRPTYYCPHYNQPTATVTRFVRLDHGRSVGHRFIHGTRRCVTPGLPAYHGDHGPTHHLCAVRGPLTSCQKTTPSTRSPAWR